MRMRRIGLNVLLIAVFVFFLQALRVIFSTMFGVIYDQIFEGPIDSWLIISNVLVILAFLSPILLARRIKWRTLAFYTAIAVLARVALSFNDAEIRYWGSLVVLAMGASVFAGLIALDRTRAWRSMLWALIIEQLLRAGGDTLDISLRSNFLMVQVAISVLLIGLAIWLLLRLPSRDEVHGGLSVRGGLAIGAFLFLETSLLALPNAMARWSEAPYAIFVVGVLAITALPLFPQIRRGILMGVRETAPRLALIFLLLAGVFFGYFGSGYGAAIALLVAQFAAVFSFVAVVESEWKSGASPGVSVSLGLLFFLLLNFFNAFSFTYAYTLPFMREGGWIVYMVASLMVAWSAFMSVGEGEETSEQVLGWPALAGLLVLILILGIFFVLPQPTEPLPGDRLRLATYNIHYGYDDDWHTTLEDIARTIESEGVDVIALQEVDTGRMTSYSVDNAYFLARRLGMHAVYLPTVEHLTGIAMLYKGSEAPSDSSLITSLGEQTGIIHTELDWIEGEIHVFGTWLGLADEDTMGQVDEALTFIGDRNPASFGADFNAELDSPEIERIKDAGFADPFELLGISPAPFTSPAIDPESRIDFVFVRDLIPVDAWVPDSLASDHRMVVVEVVFP